MTVNEGIGAWLADCYYEKKLGTMQLEVGRELEYCRVETRVSKVDMRFTRNLHL